MAEQQSDLYLDEKNLIENNQVYFELSKPVSDNDFDVLEMFLESKRQSGGGEILNIKYLADKYTYKSRTEDSGQEREVKVSPDEAACKDESSSSHELYRNFSTVSESSDSYCRFSRTKKAWALVAIYEERDVKERIIANKFFKFKDYFLRASESGYFNSAYELRDNVVIVENIDPDEDRYVMELYAEHLQPDNNEIVDIAKSQVFERTFVLTYKSAFEWDKLMMRYQKKSQLRNKRLTLWQAYQTTSLLLRAKSSSSLSADEYQKLVFDTCTDLNRSVETAGDQQQQASVGHSVVFSDPIGSDGVLLQFESPEHLTSFVQANQENFKKQDILMEQVFNFGLLKPLLIKEPEAGGGGEDTAKAHQNKSNQTDLTMKMMNIMLSKVDSSIKDQALGSASMPKQQAPQESRRNSESSLPAAATPKARSPPLPADFKLVFADPFDAHKIYVNPEEPLSVGLLNARQLFLDLVAFLKRTSSGPKIETRRDPVTRMDQLVVAIHFVNKGFRDKLTHLMHEFNTNHFRYEALPVKELSQCARIDTKSISQLQVHLAKVNSKYPAMFLFYNQQSYTIHAYGASKPNGKVIEALKLYLAKEFPRMIQLNKQQQANFDSKQAEAVMSRANSAESNRKALSQPPAAAVAKAKSTSPVPGSGSATSGQVIVFINSYDAEVNKFKLFERTTSGDTSNNKLLIHKITAKEHPVLMKCLYYCSKILEDLQMDLYQFELNLDLYVDLEPASSENAAAAASAASDDKARPMSQTLCVVLNRGSMALSEQEERLVKLKVLNLLDQYEKNRLSHSAIKLGENLNQPAFMADLVNKFTAKADLAKLLKLIDAQYDSTKVVHLEMSCSEPPKAQAPSPSRQFEIYGYATAVKQTAEYVQSSLGKLNALLAAKMQGKLEFKLTLKKNANIIVFFKFDDTFFKDFQAKLGELDAFVIKLSNDAPSGLEGQAGFAMQTASAGAVDSGNSFGKTELTLQFGCTNAKLRSKRLENWEDVSAWRLRVDQFIEKYLSYFSIELIDMPFRRDDPKASSLLYDRNMIDIIWVTSQKLQVTGVKEEIQKLRQRVLQISYGV